MKKSDLYLYIVATVLPWLVGILIAFLPNSTPQQIAKAIALPLLVWIILTVYYIVRWVVRRKSSHQNITKTAKKLT